MDEDEAPSFGRGSSSSEISFVVVDGSSHRSKYEGTGKSKQSKIGVVPRHSDYSSWKQPYTNIAGITLVSATFRVSSLSAKGKIAISFRNFKESAGFRHVPEEY